VTCPTFVGALIEGRGGGAWREVPAPNGERQQIIGTYSRMTEDLPALREGWQPTSDTRGDGTTGVYWKAVSVLEDAFRERRA